MPSFHTGRFITLSCPFLASSLLRSSCTHWSLFELDEINCSCTLRKWKRWQQKQYVTRSHISGSVTPLLKCGGMISSSAKDSLLSSKRCRRRWQCLIKWNIWYALEFKSILATFIFGKLVSEECWLRLGNKEVLMIRKLKKSSPMHVYVTTDTGNTSSAA